MLAIARGCENCAESSIEFLTKWRNGMARSDAGGSVAMRRFAKAGPIYWTLFIGLAIFAIGVMAIPKTLGLEFNNWPVTKVQADAPVAPPRTMVLRGPSPETERVAALFAAIGLFDVFVASLDDRLARAGEKIELENTESCRSAAQTLSPDSIKLECIHHAEPSQLPGCSLQISLTGAHNSDVVAQRARICVVLDYGEPCPFYDQRYLDDALRTNGLRPWASSRLLAELASPTLRSILRAIGVEPNKIGH